MAWERQAWELVAPQACTQSGEVSQETPPTLAKGPGLVHGWGPGCQERTENRGLAGAALTWRAQGSVQRALSLSLLGARCQCPPL